LLERVHLLLQLCRRLAALGVDLLSRRDRFGVVFGHVERL